MESIFFWRQVSNLTVANLKARYRKTIAGFIWVILNPLVLFAVQSFAFRNVLKVNTPNYSIFLLSGLLPWIFLTQSLEMCTGILLNSGKMLKSFPIHPLVFVMAQIVDNGINFLAAFILIGVPTAVVSLTWSARLLLIPIPIIFLFISILSLSFILSMLQVFFRDTRFLVTFLLQVFFFVTPIFYPPSLVPENFKWLIRVNLFYYLIAPFRTVILDFDLFEFYKECLSASAICVALTLLALLYWKKYRNALYFNV